MAASNLNYHNENNLKTFCQDQKFKTILADPPWQFQNRTGKMAPKHKRLNRYATMKLEDIMALPVSEVADDTCHLYLWVPNALLPEGFEVMKAWGFQYKANIVWEKVHKDGQPDGRGVGFYFRNVTELLLFGIRGNNARSLPPARSQVNLLRTHFGEIRRTKPIRLTGRLTAMPEKSLNKFYAKNGAVFQQPQTSLSGIHCYLTKPLFYQPWPR